MDRVPFLVHFAEKESPRPHLMGEYDTDSAIWRLPDGTPILNAEGLQMTTITNVNDEPEDTPPSSERTGLPPTTALCTTRTDAADPEYEDQPPDMPPTVWGPPLLLSTVTYVADEAEDAPPDLRLLRR